MAVLTLEGLRLAGVATCLPQRAEDNLARCTALYGGDAARAATVVKATGIAHRRVAAPGTSSLDLCACAAEALLKGTRTSPDEIGAVVQVTFTPERNMPCNACRAQHLLGLPTDIPAFDIGLACSGWAYGLFVAGQLARATGKKVLLLDGDVQTPRLDPEDPVTVPVLADAGTATLLAPDAKAAPWSFAFLTDGAKGEALTLPFGGTVEMDGLSVFKFVAIDVVEFISEFLEETGLGPADFSAFVPHQANMFMIRQLANELKLSDKVKVSGDELGNSGSASVPTTLARARVRGRILAAGFGGGLSASVGALTVPDNCFFKVVERG